MVTPSLPLVWQLNAIFVSTPRPERRCSPRRPSVSRLASHRKLVVHDDALGARLAPALAAAGWNVFRCS